MENMLVMERFAQDGKVKARYYLLDQISYRANALYASETCAFVTKAGRRGGSEDSLTVSRWCLIGKVRDGIVYTTGNKRYPLKEYNLN